MDAVGGRSSVDGIVARIERLPTSWWQIKTRIIVGAATFFDAFDALAIASVLPVIAPLWKLAPQQIGWLISAGFLGQLLGALVFGWVRGAAWTNNGDGLVDRALLGDEPRLRAGLGLQFAVGVPDDARD